MVILMLGSSNMGHRGDLGNDPRWERTESRRGEIGRVWKYNARLEMSTRRSTKNSLENMKGREDKEV